MLAQKASQIRKAIIELRIIRDKSIVTTEVAKLVTSNKQKSNL